MNSLEPKKQLSKDQITFINDIVHSNQFKDIVVVALAQMQMELPSPTDPSASWNNTNKMDGAKKFISTLFNIGRIEEPFEGPKPKTLNPNPEPPEFKRRELKKDK